MIEVIIYFHLTHINNHIKSVLLLLLHCDPSVIFCSKKITQVLSGDFSVQQSDMLERNSRFLDTVFKNLPDAVMYANSEMIIERSNRACERVFDNENLVGKSIIDFFKSPNFDGNVEALFSSVKNIQQKNLFTDQIKDNRRKY